ncbi:MAG: SLATT domain-containing protein, partial [Candidatus Obscuribacterales bacterium]|nr:SLATT domain-containing protein [Candidatus Obscuribacterales bacterium]
MSELSSINDEPLDVLLEEIRQAFGRVVYTHKAQEKCADSKLSCFNNVRLAQTILSAVTSTGFIAVIFGKPEIHQVSAIAGGVASLALTAINLYSQGRNTMGEVDKHTAVASKLWLARENYLSLISDIVSRTITIDDVKKQRSSLQS